MPSLVSLLREHLSAVVGAWRPGAWPVDGASIDVPVEQYTSIEHLWLTYYTDLSEHIGSCWLDERSDPGTSAGQGDGRVRRRTSRSKCSPELVMPRVIRSRFVSNGWQVCAIRSSQPWF